MGMSHFHYKDGRIVDEWTVYDELSYSCRLSSQMAERERGAGGNPVLKRAKGGEPAMSLRFAPAPSWRGRP